MKKIILVVSIFIFAAILRLYLLDSMPPGLNADEASIGYDAYSILQTGKDQYGKAFPVFFRSFAAYQSPLYIYLTVIPVFFFGVSIFSIKLVSAVSGIILVVLTFFIVYLASEKNKLSLACISTLLVAISPWSLFFSRGAIEANLALTILAFGLLFFILSFKKTVFLILSFIFFSLSTYAYHAERVISVLLIFALVAIFRKYFFKQRIIVFISSIIFVLIMLPQLLLIFSPGSTKRLDQVNYWSNSYYEQNNLSLSPLEKIKSISYEFISHYLTYFSPRSLFFDPDPQFARSLPGLSVFYIWMIIPCFFGIKNMLNGGKLNKILIPLIILSPLPASLTKEPFYTLRVLPLFFAFTIIIAQGMINILDLLKKNYFKFSLLFFLTAFSVFEFYVHYSIFFKYERSEYFGYPYIKLTEEIKKYPQYHFTVDNSKDTLYIWFALFWKIDPVKMQSQTKFDLDKDYYNSVSFNKESDIENVSFKPIDWGKVSSENEITVGDAIAISETQAKEHGLISIFEIKDYSGKVALTAYKSNFKKN